MNHTKSPLPRITILLSCLLLACLPAGRALAEPAVTKTPGTLRVYFIGNSVTDTLRYSALAELAKSRNLTLDWGRTMVPGAPLEYFYTHPQGGFSEQPYGTWDKALKEFPWDVLSLQPFDRNLYNLSNPNDPPGEDLNDVPMCGKFIGMAANMNPDVQVYIYARWPRMSSQHKGLDFDKNDYDPSKPGSGADLSKVDDFQERWNATYKPGWDLNNESASYFDQLLKEVRDKNSFLKKRPLLVPVGHVMAAMDLLMRQGKVPGYTSIYQLYKDGIHLNETGSYLVGCTYFATLLRQSPEGLPTGPYGQIDPAVAKIIQQTAWDVVSHHPDSGVQGSGSNASGSK